VLLLNEMLHQQVKPAALARRMNVRPYSGQQVTRAGRLSHRKGSVAPDVDVDVVPRFQIERLHRMQEKRLDLSEGCVQTSDNNSISRPGERYL